MRRGLVIGLAAVGVGAVVLGAIWGAGLLALPDGAPAPAVEQEGERAAAAEAEQQARAALLGDLATVGYGEIRSGVEVIGTGRGATFRMPEGRTVEIQPPEGFGLPPEFVILSVLSGGFFLEPVPTADGTRPPAPPGPLYFNFVDARRRLEPTSTEQALALYEGAASQIASAGSLPFLHGELTVQSTGFDEGAVFFCLKREDGLLYQGGTRFVGPLSVTAMRVGDCEDETAVGEMLWIAERALDPNR